MAERATKKSKKASTKAPKGNLTKKKKVVSVDVQLAEGAPKELPPTRSAAKKAEKRREAKQAERKKPLVRQTVHNETIIEENNYVGFPTPSSEMLQSFRDAAQATKKRLNDAKKAKAAKANFLYKPSRKGKKYELDLRIHSPGTLGYFAAGGVEPAAALTRLAKAKGIDMIGVTDFYNASFVDLIQKAPKAHKLTVLPGVDINCRVGACEKVQLTCLFPEGTPSSELYSVLTALGVPKQARGDSDYVVGKDFEDVLEIVESAGGVLIPSRIDKTPYRQLAIQPLVEQFGFHAFDLVHPEQPELFKSHWPEGEFTFFSFSNAHALAQIGSRTSSVKLPTPGFEGLKERVRRRV